MGTLENSLPTINSASQKYLDQAFVDEFGLPSIVLMEQAAAAVTALILKLGNSGQDVLFLAGAGNNGGDAWTSARQLAAYGYKVSVLDLFPKKSLPPDAAQNKSAFIKALDDRSCRIYQLNCNSFQEYVAINSKNDIFDVVDTSDSVNISGSIDISNSANLSDGISSLDVIDVTESNPRKLRLIPDSYDFIIDGIMGTGFNLLRPLTQDILFLLKIVNACKNTCRIAIDIPTGIDSMTGACDQEVFQADYTVTFSALKTGLAAEPGCAYSGEIIMAPLSMPKSWLETKLVNFSKKLNRDLFSSRVLTLDTVSRLETERSELSHKGNYGKTLLIGGSDGMSGAIILALQAAHATGVGYTYVRTPQTIVADLLAVSPESLIAAIPGSALSNNSDISNDVEIKDNVNETNAIHNWKKSIAEVDSVGLGPGAGKAEWLTDYLTYICSVAKKLIIDADGLNYLSDIKNWQQLFQDRVARGKEPAILTPHPGEFKRLAPDLAELLAQDRQAAASKLAKRSSTYIVLKGHATVLALPSGEVYINSSGNQSLAKAGSGDVLTGLLSGFTAQMPNQTEAAALAVFFMAC